MSMETSFHKYRVLNVRGSAIMPGMNARMIVARTHPPGWKRARKILLARYGVSVSVRQPPPKIDSDKEATPASFD